LNKLLIGLLTIITLSIALSQDEFFTPGSSIGGYGELHWNQNFDFENEQTKNTLDFHRFIMYYGYNWSEKWSFKSEVELEHNTVIPKDTDTDGLNSVTTKTGELELEQAFVNYHNGNWGFQGGVILPSVGLLNEYHEPPLFLSVERPDYNKRIIPTTWFGNGFAFYGKYSDFNFRLAFLEDLNGENISDGIRSARGKGFKTTAYSWTKNLSTTYTGINGLRVGGSLTMNDAPIDGDKDNSVAITLIEINSKYNANNIYAVLEYGKISYKNNPSEYESSSGYYIDLGYDIASLIGLEGKLIPWFRLSNVARADGVDSKTYDIFRAGLCFKPINNVAFKLDFGKVTKASESDNPTNELNIGIGYNF
jgi:hypothetical protein